ncbi:hypothetical protein [Planctomicrobium sp. SH664]|uniref:hypothetical protein n=1 Tax=Planctomicrobium sp. SH664 TaxID=3448125 RepID=UPI003F5BD703
MQTTFHITLTGDRDVQAQALAAGFERVDDYIAMLLDRDADRAVIREGLLAVEHGQMKPLEEFERNFRERNGLAPQA